MTSKLEKFGMYEDSKAVYPDHDYESDVIQLVGGQDLERLSINMDDGGYISIPFEDEDNLFQFVGLEHHERKLT